MARSMLVAGGGIGGLATVLACARAGWQVDLLEQAPVFSEVGAGIQLGPNAVRVLQSLGLGAALARVAARPERLEVRSALHGRVLGVLPLGDTTTARYGADYLTLARADLQTLLVQAVQAQGSVNMHLGTRLYKVEQDAARVRVLTLAEAKSAAHQFVGSHANAQPGGYVNGVGQAVPVWETPLLVGADGLWSQVRPSVCGDTPPRLTGHLAWRTMLPQAQLSPSLRSNIITAWLGPDFHAVQYPVRGGDWLNLVLIVHGTVVGDPANWDHHAHAGDVQRHLANAAPQLQALAHAAADWRCWPLYDRPPMAGAAEHCNGRIALVGDAAHPMRPYMAQGAGMALEDAAALAQCLVSVNRAGQHAGNVPDALQTFARQRWQRNARVQSRALRNGTIFHLHGPLRLGRDLVLRLLGQRLLDLPWLYAGP